MKRKNWTQLAILASALGFGVSADTIWTGATDLDFGTSGNWDNGSPGNSDGIARINNGDAVTLTSDHIGANPYDLYLSGNSSLTASATFTSTLLNIASGSTVSFTGGAYTLPRTSGPGNGSGLVVAAGATLEVSGGDHYFDERSWMSGTFRVVGSGPDPVGMHQIGGASGTFEFIMDSSGVRTIEGQGSFPWLNISASSVFVDGSAFSGTGSFTLFDGDDAGNTFDPSNLTVNGLGAEGVGWTIEINNNASDSVIGRDTVILHVIPEPGFAGLMGLGLAMALLLRRRG